MRVVTPIPRFSKLSLAPWTECRGSRGSPRPSHTFFKFSVWKFEGWSRWRTNQIVSKTNLWIGSPRSMHSRGVLGSSHLLPFDDPPSRSLPCPRPCPCPCPCPRPWWRPRSTELAMERPPTTEPTAEAPPSPRSTLKDPWIIKVKSWGIPKVKWRPCFWCVSITGQTIRSGGSMKNCSGMNFWSQRHAASLMFWQLLEHFILSLCFKSYYEIPHVKWVPGVLGVIIQALAKCKCHLRSRMNLSNSIPEKKIKAPKTELPPCQSSHVLMLQLSRGICSFAWMSFCFKVFEGDPLRVEKMLFSVYLKYSFSGSGLSEGWEGFLNIRGSNTTLKIQCSKLWGKIFKKWWYDYLWPGAGIWSDRVREITAKMFHCTWNRNKTNSALFKENENREPSNDSGRLWLKGSAAFWTVKSCFWFEGGLKRKFEFCHFWDWSTTKLSR